MTMRLGRTCIGTLVIIVFAAVLTAVRHDQRAGPVAVVALAVSALALVEVSVVLVALRRHDRDTGERALFDLDVARRAEAVAAEHPRELEGLRTEIARLAARVETAGRASGSRAPCGPDEDTGDQGGRAVLGWRP